jgi:hypothetical protein
MITIAEIAKKKAAKKAEDEGIKYEDALLIVCKEMVIELPSSEPKIKAVAVKAESSRQELRPKLVVSSTPNEKKISKKQRLRQLCGPDDDRETERDREYQRNVTLCGAPGLGKRS